MRLIKITLIAILGFFNYYSTAEAAGREPLFYALASDATSKSLLDLASIAGDETNSIFVMVDLFRSPERIGLIATWRTDCKRGTMQIIKAAQFTPSHSIEPKAIKSEVVAAGATPRSMLAFKLACSDEGALLASRTYYDDQPDIVRRFWSR